jgi:LysM repeat protein
MFEKRNLSVLLLIVALIVPTVLSGQVPVDVSNQKIISGGKTYYMHLVLKDQTLYSISKAYQVSIDAITRENVIPPNGIQTDQILKIPESAAMAREQAQAAPRVEPKAQPETMPAPVSEISKPAEQETKPAEPSPKAESENYRMHKVKKGETLYSISRDYSVTVQALIRVNDVPRNEIKAGQMLRIPPSDFETFVKEEPSVMPEAEVKTESETKPQTQSEVATPAPEKKPAKAEPKKYHKVQKGESLADIAKKYDVSVREIKDANDGLLFPMPGMKLLIPAKSSEEIK